MSGRKQLVLWLLIVGGFLVVGFREGATTITWVLAAVAGAGGVANYLATVVKPSATTSTDAQVDDAAAALANKVRQQWDKELRARALVEDKRLPVRCRPLYGGSETERTCDEVVSAYVDDPHRMVVTGKSGAGKTGLLILLALAVLRRQSSRSVPVILSVSDWNPRQNFQEWVLEAVLGEYPFLASEKRYGPTAVLELLRRGRLLLLLDNLDQMGAEPDTSALRTIERDLDSGRPFVLACQSGYFAAANAAGTIPDSDVVVLLPFRPEEVVDHLRSRIPQVAVDRWEPVLEELRENDPSPLGAALETPFMLTLAQDVYSERGSKPADLLELTDADAMRAALLRDFPRKALDERPGSPTDHEPSSRAPGWDLDRQVDWLTFLAREYGEIAWWELVSKVPRWVVVARGVLVGGGVSAVLGLLLLGLFGRPVLGLVVGFALGAASGALLARVPAEPPRRFAFRRLRGVEVARDLVFAVVGAVAGAVAVGLVFGGLPGAVTGLVFGVLFGLVRRFTELTDPAGIITPTSSLHDDRKAVLTATGLGAALGTAVGAVLGGVVGVADLGLVVPVTDPLLVGALGAAVGLVLGAGGIGLATYSTSACGRYDTARIWLALTRRTPLRLMRFLHHAHQRTVLRLVGPTYQFRHELLRKELARPG
ncbi:NACHT domain-containing protein [Actinokineospora sp. PR83]|uniref:NACHT domain-containing protein n=1 Tax=Actinokineospora sp. PR83 TaxID=2884908 RepID=UPI0027E190D6|nr:NACHT domain-containing protein [Actinokineospora sp. PR83]MCG8915683.1 NACHT domain-containing protein [Actinokineospora sp. PR83]